MATNWQGGDWAQADAARGRGVGRALRDRLGAQLDRLMMERLRPDWALHLPDLPGTVSLGPSRKARRFQHEFGRLRQFGSWASSHVCLMHVIARFPAAGPRRYLEVGVSEGISVLAVATALQVQRLLSGADPARPLFDELVLADTWQPHFGGMGRGSHEHVARRLSGLHVPLGPVQFLDGDSKATVPAYLGRRDGVAFDAIYIDGDHTYAGARADLDNVLPHLGHMLFLDDIYHPAHCLKDRLLCLHRQLVARLQGDFYAFVNRAGYGFAAFIRKPLVDALVD